MGKRCEIFLLDFNPARPWNAVLRAAVADADLWTTQVKDKLTKRSSTLHRSSHCKTFSATRPHSRRLRNTPRRSATSARQVRPQATTPDATTGLSRTCPRLGQMGCTRTAARAMTSASVSILDHAPFRVQRKGYISAPSAFRQRLPIVRRQIFAELGKDVGGKVLTCNLILPELIQFDVCTTQTPHPWNGARIKGA
eukprot:701117-Amphidinium_carterae.1